MAVPRSVMLAFSIHFTVWCALSVVNSVNAAAKGGTQKLSVEPNGTVQVPAFELPLSGLLNGETQSELKREAQAYAELQKSCLMDGVSQQAIVTARRCFAKQYYRPLIARQRAVFAVTIQPETIAGVPTEIIMPAEGVSATNQQRVLLNLHGDGFLVGGRWGGQVESIPIAATGKFKVVSVNYRMAPEYQFPAASEDVVAVYRELLKTYEPKNIGIFGSSAGGLLTAQVVAWLQREGLPAPGAIGMFCAAGGFWGDGDSGHFSAALQGIPVSLLTVPQDNPYLRDTVSNDPLVFPIRSPEVVAKFPPSLLITSTRDQALSSVVQMHSLLVAQGVEAELHVWEGLGHEFFAEPLLPQSREVYNITVKFFARYLGRHDTAVDVPVPHPNLDELLRPEIDQFVKADQRSPPVPCQVLFLGSSSIVNWQTLEADMRPLPVIKRGFGGSQVEHVNLWFDQIVTPYRPRAIVLYEGENDIAAGKQVSKVLADFDAFMARKTAALGQTPVYFISIKPSKLRLWQIQSQTQVNEGIRARAATRSDLHYIDVVALMMNDGKPKNIFVDDNLHMTPAGYAIWTQAVRSALLPEADSEARICLRMEQKDHQGSHR